MKEKHSTTYAIVVYCLLRLVARFAGPTLCGSSALIALGVSGAVTVPSEPATVFRRRFITVFDVICFSSGGFTGMSVAFISFVPIRAAISASMACGGVANGASSSSGNGHVTELLLNIRSFARTRVFLFCELNRKCRNLRERVIGFLCL